MSTETQSGEYVSLAPGVTAPAEDFDRILSTASDRPQTDTLPALTDPAADHSDPIQQRRREDIEEKHRRVIAFLDANGLDSVILGRADSVAWFTSGGDFSVDLGTEMSTILLFLNRTCRAVITDNVQSARVFEEELAGLGFQLKERAWHDDPARVVNELTHNKRVACDLGPRTSPWAREVDSLRALRQTLTAVERQRLRELGRALTRAVEATCRNFIQGETEADVAGHLAHRLIREGVIPADLRIAGDDRLERYRQPGFKSSPIRKKVTLTVSGRRFGLSATLSRTVSFGPLDHESLARHSLATMVDATCIYFSRPGESVSEVLRRAKRIYAKFDHPDEWMLDYSGFIVGYSPREALLCPESPLILSPEMAMCWSPSVGSSRSSDTIVIDHRGYECVTNARNWPKLDVAVKGFLIPRPGILER